MRKIFYWWNCYMCNYLITSRHVQKYLHWSLRKNYLILPITEQWYCNQALVFQWVGFPDFLAPTAVWVVLYSGNSFSLGVPAFILPWMIGWCWQWLVFGYSWNPSSAWNLNFSWIMGSPHILAKVLEGFFFSWNDFSPYCNKGNSLDFLWVIGFPYTLPVAQNCSFPVFFCVFWQWHWLSFSSSKGLPYILAAVVIWIFPDWFYVIS